MRSTVEGPQTDSSTTREDDEMIVCGPKEGRWVEFEESVVCRTSMEFSDLLLVSAGLLGEEDGLDVGQDTSLSDGHSAQQLVQLLVVADGQLKVTRVDSRLLVVAGSVAGQLEHFSGEVLQNSGQVDLKA